MTFLCPPTTADRSQSSQQVRAPRGFPLTVISASRGEGAAQRAPRSAGNQPGSSGPPPWSSPGPCCMEVRQAAEVRIFQSAGGSTKPAGGGGGAEQHPNRFQQPPTWAHGHPLPLGLAPPAATHPSPSMGAASIPEHAQYGLIFSHYRALMTCKQKEVSLAKGEERKKVQDSR